MLNSIHIQNFRLFKDFHINDLAPVNLIVGKNNVGKSTLLEAIYLLVKQQQQNDFLDTLLNLVELRGESTGASPGGRHYHLKHSFFAHKFESKTPIRLASNGANNFSLEICPVPDRNSIEVKPGLAEEFSLPVNSVGDFKRGFQDRFPPVPEQIVSQYIRASGLNYLQLRHLWDQIQLTPKEDNVVQALKILENNVQRIGFQMADSGIIVKLEDEEPVPLGNMGDGMSRILGIVMSLVTSAGGYLLVDEIDTGLHYRAITDMWRLIIETATRLDIQVMATTHSYDCLRSFAEALEMQGDKTVGALFRLQRRDEEIQAVKHDAERLAFAITQDVELR